MQVMLLGETVQFANQISEIEAIFDYINTKLEGSNYHFSHMVIDNQEVYEDVEGYIEEHIQDIETIEVKVMTVQEFVHELLFSADDYIKRASPEVNRLIEEFYQGPTEDSWHHLAQFLEGLTWLNAMFQSIDQSSYVPHNWDDYLIVKARLHNELKQLEEALQNADYTLTADIIQYEIMPILESLTNTIRVTVDREGYPQHSN